jgi:predicted DNA binding CopG/RHH family protein
MSRRKLNQEEQEIVEAFESGRLKRLPNLERERKAHREMAEATFKKDTRINIRLSSRDLRALQARALREGFPIRRWYPASYTSMSMASWSRNLLTVNTL